MHSPKFNEVPPTPQTPQGDNFVSKHIVDHYSVGYNIGYPRLRSGTFLECVLYCDLDRNLGRSLQIQLANPGEYFRKPTELSFWSYQKTLTNVDFNVYPISTSFSLTFFKLITILYGRKNVLMQFKREWCCGIVEWNGRLMDRATLTLLLIFVLKIHNSKTGFRQDTGCKMFPTLSLSSLPSNILFNFLDKGLFAGGPLLDDTSGSLLSAIFKLFMQVNI